MLTRRSFIPLLGAALLARPAFADTPMVFAPGGVAINGYDPVAYFTVAKPVMGKAKHRVIWKGAEWRFSSAANQAAFESDPRAFAPQYGGYCAYAVSRAYTATTQPDAWRVHKGRLYLNHNQRVRSLWVKDIPGNVTKANANWPGVLSN